MKAESGNAPSNSYIQAWIERESDGGTGAILDGVNLEKQNENADQMRHITRQPEYIHLQSTSTIRKPFGSLQCVSRSATKSSIENSACLEGMFGFEEEEGSCQHHSGYATVERCGSS